MMTSVMEDVLLSFNWRFQLLNNSCLKVKLVLRTVWRGLVLSCSQAMEVRWQGKECWLPEMKLIQ